MHVSNSGTLNSPSGLVRVRSSKMAANGGSVARMSNCECFTGQNSPKLFNIYLGHQ